MKIRPTLVALAAAVALPALAGAQDSTPTTPPAVPATGDSTDAGTPRDPYWALIGSYEQDTHDVRTGLLGPQYVHPFGDDKAWFAYVFGTYLHYEFDNRFGGRTEVDSPGLSPGLGLMWFKGRTQWAVNAGLGFKDRERTVTDAGGHDVGSLDDGENGGQVDVQVGGQVYSDFTDRQNLEAIVSYGTADQYLWARAGYKVRVTSGDRPVGLAVGVEGIGQGNDEITSWQGGGLVEFQLNRSNASVMLRGGYKKSTFEEGGEETGPYWGVNLYKRF